MASSAHVTDSSTSCPRGWTRDAITGGLNGYSGSKFVKMCLTSGDLIWLCSSRLVSWKDTANNAVTRYPQLIVGRY